MAHQIVNLSSWGEMDKSDWMIVYEYLSSGKEFVIKSFSSNDEYKWNDGKASLKIKDGKKRKLIPGRIWLEECGFDDESGITKYVTVFQPNKPLSRNLHSMSAAAVCN